MLLLSPTPFQDLLQEKNQLPQNFSLVTSLTHILSSSSTAKHPKHSTSETKHTHAILFKDPTLSFLCVTLYMEAGNWRQSRLSLSTSRWAMSLTSRGWQQRLHRLHIPAGTLFWVTGPCSEQELSSCTHIPNKCPSSDCHHGIKLYSFPWSSSLWLVFQYRRKLKTFNSDYANTCC